MLTIPPGSIVILHLVNPTEKVWGLLGELGLHGVTIRGISVNSFDDWVAQAVREDEPRTLDLVTVFLPLFRLEKMYLDEPVGVVESYQERFEKRVGVSVTEFLGLERVLSVSDADSQLPS